MSQSPVVRWAPERSLLIELRRRSLPVLCDCLLITLNPLLYLKFLTKFEIPPMDYPERSLLVKKS